MTKTVLEILGDWLIENGYEGLWNGDDCGCRLSDLAPCGEPSNHCMPGHLTEGCTAECGQGCSFHINAKPSRWKEKEMKDSLLMQLALTRVEGDGWPDDKGQPMMFRTMIRLPLDQLKNITEFGPNREPIWTGDKHPIQMFEDEMVLGAKSLADLFWNILNDTHKGRRYRKDGWNGGPRNQPKKGEE